MIQDIDSFDFSLLNGNKRGIEREGLRVNSFGKIATTHHPKSLGEKLTHPYITVDFSEGLLELITPPMPDSQKSLNFLSEITRYTYKKLNKNEMIWASSIPPNLNNEDILIANFGNSNSAKMKKVYRKGLSLRYGKYMQVISGIHYNFSISEDFLNPLYNSHLLPSKTLKNNAYFRLIKKYYQISWIIPYLFGCSPICSRSLLTNNKDDSLRVLDNEYYYGEYATSLRMSDLGYKSKAQESLFVSCKNIDSYVCDLLKATQTRYPDYIRNGILDGNGNYQQLNDSILQIENEYYNTIRPKQIANPGERPANALLNRGVQYVELRSLDVDIYKENGICELTSNFIEVYLIFCLISNEIPYNECLVLEANDNFTKVVKFGRKKNLELVKNEKNILLKTWAEEILESCLEISKKMDQALKSGNKYKDAVYEQLKKVNDINTTPSARLLADLKSWNGNTHDFICNLSKQHKEKSNQHPMKDERMAFFDKATKDSIHAFNKLENKEEETFEDYLNSYYS